MNNVNQLWAWIKSQTFPSNQGQHKFYVQSQPEDTYTNSTITLKCFSDSTKQRPIPCRFTWSRVRQGLVTPLGQVRGNVYECQPADVGALIKVEITSLEEECPGTAFEDFGPVRIDVQSRYELEKLVSRKEGQYKAKVCGPFEFRDISVRVTDNLIIFKDSLNKSNSFKTEYRLDEPMVEVNPKESNLMTLRFSKETFEDVKGFLEVLFEKEDLRVAGGRNIKLELSFSSRQERDQFLYLYKAFSGKKETITACILSQLENLSVTHNQKFDYLLEIENLKHQINSFGQLNHQLEIEKQFYQSEVERLEEEIALIIGTYTKIVEQKFKDQIDLNSSYSILTNKRERIFRERNSQLEKQNKEFSRRIQNLTEYLNNKAPSLSVIHSHAHSGVIKKEAPFEEIENRLQQLSQMNCRLVKENEQLRITTKRNESMENVLDELNEEGEDVKRSPGIEEKKNLELEQLLTERNNDSQKSMHVPLLGTSFQELQRENIRLGEENQKLLELREYDKSNHLLELSRHKDSPSVSLAPSPQETEDKYRQLRQHCERLEAENLKLKRRTDEQREEMTILKKGQDILNKSRDLSMEINSHNQNEKEVLKEQNTMLLQENEKLRKMCERYMGDAKETNRLRGEVVGLRRRLEVFTSELPV